MASSSFMPIHLIVIYTLLSSRSNDLSKGGAVREARNSTENFSKEDRNVLGSQECVESVTWIGKVKGKGCTSSVGSLDLYAQSDMESMRVYHGYRSYSVAIRLALDSEGKVSTNASGGSMSQIDVPLSRGSFGQTQRADKWWVQPLVVFLGLSAFIVYSTWAALQGQHFRFGPYLSPFYSPELFGPAHEGWFGPSPSWMPAWVTGAVLILWAPGGFRVTCYYYRGAYYKAFWADPPSCTVGEPRKTYLGERSFPLILQNVHRYFLYLALVFLVILGRDVWNAFWFDGRFGIGVGTLVLLTNLLLLSSYAIGCHSLRHLVGGFRDRLAGAPSRKRVYDCVSCLNRRHMLFAWCSLFSVAFSDLYVRMCSMGIWTDWRIV
jgi:hypothetical protein